MKRIRRIDADLFYKTSVRIRSICSIRVLFLFLFVASSHAQDTPDRIRGYKVHRAEVSVVNRGDRNSGKIDAEIAFGEPVLTDVSSLGISFELPAEIKSIAQKARIDFLTFQDFRVNGLRVRIDEYQKPFVVEKNKIARLADPVKVRVSFAQAARGALSEWRESKPEWTVTGTVFVFGRFKKSFLTFKRVVPVKINLKIKNPL